MNKAKKVFLVLFAIAIVASMVILAACKPNGDEKITYGADDLVYVTDKDSLIVNFAGRNYYKASNGSAVVGLAFNGTYSGPILVGKSPDSVRYYYSGYDGTRYESKSSGSIEFEGETYYYCNTEGWFMGSYLDFYNKLSAYCCEAKTLKGAAEEIIRLADKSKLTLAQITTVEQLKALANTAVGVELGADIDLSSETEWTPIEGFKGTLYGNGHSIKNLTLKVKSSDNVGLFGTLQGVANGLKLENVSITGMGSGKNVGAIAGTNSGKVINCEVSGAISSIYSENVGGLVGYSNKPDAISNNVNNVDVEGYNAVGGVVGKLMFGKNNVSFSSNVNNGAITGAAYVGGVVGKIDSSVSNGASEQNIIATISDCENNGAVTSAGNYVGGIVGSATGDKFSTASIGGAPYRYLYFDVSDCENNGEVTGKDYTAGILGHGEYVRSVTTCVNAEDIVGGNFVGGYVGYSSGTATSNMINGSSITGKGYVGGIAGYTGNVVNCKNTGAVISIGMILEGSTNKYCLGGIAGYCTGATNCSNSVDITAELAGRYVGGIAGYMLAKNDVVDNTNSGAITASLSTHIGGIVGRIQFPQDHTVKNNANEAAVAGASYVGGIIGYVDCKISNGDFNKNLTAEIVECENDGKVTATADYAGGIIGYAVGAVFSQVPIGGYPYAYLYFAVSTNVNNASVVAGGSNFAAIVGKAGDYVNSQNAILWQTNIDNGDVGKLYN